MAGPDPEATTSHPLVTLDTPRSVLTMRIAPLVLVHAVRVQVSVLSRKKQKTGQESPIRGECRQDASASFKRNS